MALAKYFSKDALAISQLLRKGSVDLLEKILERHVVEIAFDDEIRSTEAQTSLDLVIRLICRLYPKVKITDLSGRNQMIVAELQKQGKSINSNIEFSEESATAKLVMGKTDIKGVDAIPVFYIGSDGWLVKFSTQHAVSSGGTNLPFAAGFSACIGAANLFRFVFKELIQEEAVDEYISLSLLDLTFKESENGKASLESWGDITLVGLGAIGNGALWALSRLNTLKGHLTVVDNQQISLSNLQRYVLTEEVDEGRDKIELPIKKVASEIFTIDYHLDTWQTFIKKTGRYNNSVILTALDSAKDRIAVQSSLPQHIFNGFTEVGLLGVSRHINFLDKACVGCVYLPGSKKKNYSEEVAENLSIPQFEKQIRGYLYDNSPVDEKLLAMIAEANQINISDLNQYRGVAMSEFYTNFVCGGILLSLKNSNNQNIRIEAPLAFQSALAGILLTSELYLWKAGYRTDSFPVMTHIYPLIRMQAEINPYNHQLTKDPTNKCVCTDQDFRIKYAEKWAH